MSSYSTNVNETLKTQYANVHDTLNSMNKLWKMIGAEYDQDGREVVDLYRIRGTGAIGFQGETASLPIPMNQGYANSSITPHLFTGRVGFGWKLEAMSKTNRGAFKKAMRGEVEGAVLDIDARLEMKAAGRRYGECGIVNTVPSATTVTLTRWQDARLCRENSIIQFWDPGSAAPDFSGDALSSSGSGETAFRVTNVADNGTLVTLTVVGYNPTTGADAAATDITAGSFPVAAGDYIYFFGDRTATALTSVNGVETLISNNNSLGISGAGTLQGLSVTQGFWNVASIAATSSGTGPMTDTICQEAIDAVHIRGGKKINMFFGSYGTRLRFAVDSMATNRRINTTVIAGKTARGFTEDLAEEHSVAYGEVDYYMGRFFSPNTVYGTRTGNICRYYWQPEGWREQPGGNLAYRALNGNAEDWVDYWGVFTVCIKDRKDAVRITNVAEAESHRAI